MLTGTPHVALDDSVCLKRSETLIYFWEDDALVVENFLTGRQATVNCLLLPLIEYLSSYIPISQIQQIFTHIPQLSSILEQLLALDILVKQGNLNCQNESLLRQWEWGLEAKYYHFKTNYTTFECRDEMVWKNLAEKARVKISPPSAFYRLANIDYTSLPEPGNLPNVDLTTLLKNRRTCRAFLKRSISMKSFSTLIYYCWGMLGRYNRGDLGEVIFKTSPSGGARHPVELYMLVNNVEDVTPGVYHYDVERHMIGRMKAGDMKKIGVAICSGQQWVEKSAVLFILTCMLKRSMWKYENAHAFRVVHIDAGHLGQTFHLVCRSLGLGPFTTAATDNKNDREPFGCQSSRTACFIPLCSRISG